MQLFLFKPNICLHMSDSVLQSTISSSMANDNEATPAPVNAVIPRRRRRTAFAWEHMVRLDNGYSECTVCNQVYQPRTSTSTLKFHLNTVHNLFQNPPEHFH